MSGKVTLVGAGPGDFGLLTLKGKKAIENAEVVVYDRLVSKEILSLVAENAEKINVGKECGNHLIPQEQINRILIEKALEGKNVVRLKGGDCFVFGRGGEELLEITKNNIEFDVVPGITSALAVPTYAGIPVTHRDFVSSVHIITGHQKENGKPKIDFESLVKLNGTLIFLMGLKNLEFIANGLVEAGMNQNMACAVIEEGTKNIQRNCYSTLNEISAKVSEMNIKSPAIIIVGEVCTLADKLNWFERLPLRGKKVIVTRPKDRNSIISEKLKALGAIVTENPCIKIKNNIEVKISFQEIMEKIKNSNWIVFTSPGGVSVLFDTFKQFRVDSRIFGDKKIAVIGKGTGNELCKYGIFHDLQSEKYYSENLAEDLINVLEKNDKVCILRAEKGSPALNKTLSENNIEYYDLGIYETVYENENKNNLVEKINSNDVDFVVFTSRSTVEAFCTITDGANYSKFKSVCIGEKTAEAAKEHHIDYCVSDEQSMESIINKLIEMGN